MDDMLKLKVGTIFDILITNMNLTKETKNNKYDDIREATKNDDILSFL